MATVGKKFLAAVVAKGTVSELLGHGSIEHLFRGNEIPVWDFVRSFVKEYGAVPKPDTILAHAGEELPEAPEPPGYYIDLMQIRHIEYELKAGMKKAGQQLMPDGEGAEAALATVTGTAMELVHQRHKSQIADLRDAYELLLPAYVAKKKGMSGGLPLGWPYLDEMTGGLLKGDMISYVGRPSQGKSWMMLYGAHHGWLKERARQGLARRDPHVRRRWR